MLFDPVVRYGAGCQNQARRGGKLGRPPLTHPTELCYSLLPVPCSLFPTPCSLLPAPCSLLPTPYSLLPKTQHFVPKPI
ncbi:MAG: hypothetical protein F6K56_32985 [Moorea sp. SIO3G5]|nr:hypothetical protein [Moorena sp. SIO3G5]